MISFSIIIPHKDIPELLQRCLDSIPQREDLEVIVVDDNSSLDIVDFNNFPGKDRPDVKVIFTKEGKGAGYARNVGLQNARSKWVIFLDADDLFVPDVEAILSQIEDRTEDVLYFNYHSALSDDLSMKGHRTLYHRYFVEYKDTHDETDFRYRFHALWGKVIKRKLIEKWDIRCDETRYSNDVAMSIKCGMNAENIAIFDKPLVFITERQGSLASSQQDRCKQTPEEFEIRLGVAMSCQNYIYKHGKDVDLKQYKDEALNYLAHHKLSFVLFFLRNTIIHPRLCYKIFKEWKRLH